LNTLSRSWLFLILMGIALTFLPACGNKSNVNSETASQTVLNQETPVPVSNGEIGLGGEKTGVHTYVEKIHRTKNANSTTSITTTPVTSAGVSAAIPPIATNPTPAVETAAPVKRSGGSHWLVWILVLLVIGLAGYYFWNKSRENQVPTQPMPPTGGLSPVSGFTALKNQIEDEAESKPSVWTKKLF